MVVVREVEAMTIVAVLEVVRLLVWTLVEVAVAVVVVVVGRVETLTITCVAVVVVVVSV